MVCTAYIQPGSRSITAYRAQMHIFKARLVVPDVQTPSLLRCSWSTSVSCRGRPRQALACSGHQSWTAEACGGSARLPALPAQTLDASSRQGCRGVACHQRWRSSSRGCAQSLPRGGLPQLQATAQEPRSWCCPYSRLLSWTLGACSPAHWLRAWQGVVCGIRVARVAAVPGLGPVCRSQKRW